MKTQAPAPAPLPPLPSMPARPALSPGHVLVPLGAAVSLLPFVSTGVALVAGVALALTVGNPYLPLTRKATHPLLSLAVVGLGAGMDLRAVAAAGAHGLIYTVVGISTCLALGVLLARLLKVPGATGLLISVGTAICGGSAIAAVVPVLRPKEHEVSVALGTVFLLNAVALLLFPSIGHALALTQQQFGLWSALAIHDTSSVVGAAVQYGHQALEVATTVKLARALWIVPLTIGLGAWHGRRQQVEGPKAKTHRPWFILGFLAAAALTTFVPALRSAGHLVANASRQLLVLTLFLIGANLTRSALQAVGVRPLAQGVALWATMGTLTLGAVLRHVIR